MALGYDGKLYILAFDHRGSFQKKMFGIQGDPDPRGDRDDRRRQAADLRGHARGGRARARRPGATGVLVDEQFGSDIPERAPRARPQAGDAGREVRPGRVRLPVRRRLRRPHREVQPRLLQGARPLQPRRRRRDEQEPARAAEAARRLAARERPQVPVRAAGAGDRRAAGQRRRRHRPLRRRAASRADAPGDRGRPERGIEVDIWKIEGVDEQSRRRDARRAGPHRPGSRGSHVRAARSRRVDRESRAVASSRPPRSKGFIGFAIGRSIWWDALKGYLAEELEREAAATQIAENYLHFVRVYEQQAVH